MENDHIPDPGFKSELMWRLDRAAHEMEERIRELTAERDALRDELATLSAETYARERDALGTMIAGGLMACIGTPSVHAVTPAAVTMFSRIMGMSTIEEVKEYVGSFMESAKAELSEQAETPQP